MDSASFQMSSLYVGDLHPDVTESMLLNKFSSVVQVYSVHLCRDKTTGKSLRHAFVNFQQRADAECAMELLRFDSLLGQPMRIMWSQRDSSLRQTNMGNIFIKNTAVKAEPPSVPTADSVSLYVGDLHPDVTESMLLSTFSSVVDVNSVHLCRDKTTGKSLQHAFVNFQKRADAERAMELLSFDSILGQPMRIMWSQRDSSLRQSNVGNIFIKNLEKSVDSATLYNTFSSFGKILSCKVAYNKNGPRGFGYIQFERAQDAEAAIKRLNGMLLKGRKLLITHFKSRQEREAVNKTAEENDVAPTVPATAPEVPVEAPSAVKIAVPTGANTAVKAEPPSVPTADSVSLYVGDLHPDVTESMLLSTFSSVVDVNSVHLCRDKMTGKSLQYAFVNFQKRADAESAMELLKLEKSVDSATLYNTFSSFGKILSCKVARNKNGPRGFGSVQFERAQDAEAAIKRLNGMLLKGRKLSIRRFKSCQKHKAVNKTSEKNVIAPTVPAGNIGIPAKVSTTVKKAAPPAFRSILKKAVPAERKGKAVKKTVRFSVQTVGTVPPAVKKC